MKQVAVVTGGSRGIGAATARRLAAEGWSVCLSYRSAAGAAQDVVAACRAEGVEALAVPADIASPDDVAALFRAADGLGRLGALVNNAGTADRQLRVDQMPPERILRMTAVNVAGPFLCAGEAVRRMSSLHGGEGGAIVNISSAAARLRGPGEGGDYAATKRAIEPKTNRPAPAVGAEGGRGNGGRAGLRAQRRLLPRPPRRRGDLHRRHDGAAGRGRVAGGAGVRHRRGTGRDVGVGRARRPPGRAPDGRDGPGGGVPGGAAGRVPRLSRLGPRQRRRPNDRR